MSEAMSGHFANMDRLVEAGQLWLAGPLGSTGAAHDDRGVFLLATADTAEGLALAQTDPAVQAGVFVLEAHSLSSGSALEHIVDLDRAHQAAREAARPGEDVPWEGRAYVLARHLREDASDAIVASLRDSGVALFDGLLDDRDWLVCLDAQDLTAARSALVAAGAVKLAGEWTLMPWYATTGLVDLPSAR